MDATPSSKSGAPNQCSRSVISCNGRPSHYVADQHSPVSGTRPQQWEASTTSSCRIHFGERSCVGSTSEAAATSNNASADALEPDVFAASRSAKHEHSTDLCTDGPTSICYDPSSLLGVTVDSIICINPPRFYEKLLNSKQSSQVSCSN